MFIAYDVLQHGAMLRDRVRTGAYLSAIRQVVRPGDTVLDLGSGTGVFAVEACRAGANRVYAVEPGPIVQVGREIVAANGCSSRVEFIEELSVNVTLPERVDVVVMDVRGVLPDEQIPTGVDARRRLLRDGGRMIPLNDVIWAAPVSAPDLFTQFVGAGDIDGDGVDVRAKRRVAIPRWYKCRTTLEGAWGEPQRLATIDYLNLASPDLHGRAEWRVPSPIVAHGFVVWFESHLCDGIGVSNHPDAPPAIYGQGFFPWPEPTSLAEGQIVTLDWDGSYPSDGYAWRWMTTIASPEEAGDAASIRFDQSSRPPRLPLPTGPTALTDAARLDLETLDLIAAGGLTIGEIATRLMQQHEDVFAVYNDALTWVGRVSGRFAMDGVTA